VKDVRDGGDSREEELSIKGTRGHRQLPFFKAPLKGGFAAFPVSSAAREISAVRNQEIKMKV